MLLAIVIAFGVLLLALMVVGWLGRRRRQRGFPVPPAVPAELGGVQGVFAGKYVATSRGGLPLERIVAHGLGFRGGATATVASAGILIDRVGERAVWIPLADVRDVRRATWTIDRVVETDGLTLVQWQLGDLVVDTTLRLDEPSGFDAAIAALVPTLPAPSERPTP